MINICRTTKLRDKDHQLKKCDQTSDRPKLLVYALAGAIGSPVLAGIIISGGLLPKVNKGASPVVQASSSSLPPVLGAIHGYVGGQTGLPSAGAAVVAAEQLTGYTVNSIVSIDGQYSFTLPPGKYIVLVAYPDGTNKKVGNFQVEYGKAYSLDFSY